MGEPLQLWSWLTTAQVPRRRLEVEESEETPKRPKIDFGDRRVAGPLRITKGHMGPRQVKKAKEGS